MKNAKKGSSKGLILALVSFKNKKQLQGVFTLLERYGTREGWFGLVRFVPLPWPSTCCSRKYAPALIFFSPPSFLDFVSTGIGQWLGTN